jgi:PTS system mannose-specific IIA component
VLTLAAKSAADEPPSALPDRTTGHALIGILIVAHDSLGDSFARAVTHVLGTRPAQFEVLSVAATDDPLQLLPAAREQVARLDTGEGVLVFSDIYGATPCNLACKLLQPGRVEGLAGVNLPMLVRAFTYRTKGMETMIMKAVSGGCDGVLHIKVDPVYAATRS